MTHLFPGFCRKRREGKGVPEKTVRKEHENSVIFMVFRVRSFLSIQGARSRGPGREMTNRPGPGKGVLEDTFSTTRNPGYMAFAATFPASG